MLKEEVFRPIEPQARHAWEADVPTLEGSRVLLRMPCEEDAGPLFRNCTSHAEACRHLQWLPHAREADTAEHLRSQEQERLNDRNLTWVILHRSTGAAMGFASACYFPEGMTAVIGYMLGPAFWRQGYASEACRLLLAWLRARPAVARIGGLCEATNIASERTLLSLGMRKCQSGGIAMLCPGVSSKPTQAYWYFDR